VAVHKERCTLSTNNENWMISQIYQLVHFAEGLFRLCLAMLQCHACDALYRLFSALNLSQASFRLLNTAPLIITCSVVAVVGSCSTR
jgi:hypothetical protein